jgi:hypothetical protein
VDRHTVFSARCADNCIHDALLFGDESELDLSNTEVFHPEYELATRVYYKSLPKRFVAGTVYTPEDNEVVVGAICTLTGATETYTATTDDFGDFWLDGVPSADFTLKIEADGKSVTMDVSTKDEDIGLGDIALT